MTLLISHIRAQKSGGWECSLRNYDQGGRVKTESSTKKMVTGSSRVSRTGKLITETDKMQHQKLQL